MPPQGGAKEAGIARRFCCAGFPAGNGRRLLSLQGKGLRPIFFTCSHPGLAALRAAPRGITRRLRAAKTRPRTNGSGGAAGKFPAEQTEKDAEAAFPKTSPGKRIATSAGAGDLPAFAPSAACPPVGVSARRRVRPSARPSVGASVRRRVRPADCGAGAEQSPRRKFSAAGGQCHKKYSVVRNYPKTVLFTNP